MTEILHKALSDTIIGIAIDVQKELGQGFLERVYENSLVIALRDKGLAVDQQQHLEVLFRGQVVGDYVADLIIESKIILEIKAVETMARVHYAQLINYLKASGLEVGYVINFSRIPLQFKRLSSINIESGER